jgi:uroporphyrin-3 C-methyltransferase
MPAMTTETPPTDTAPATPAPAADAAPRRPVRQPDPAPRGGGAALALSILLSLGALGAAGYTAWTVWQMRGDLGAANGLREQVGQLSAQVNGLSEENATLRRRVADADGVNRSAQEAMLGVSERTKHLEDAVANLSERSLSGHDAMLLDEAESLLRMAKERFALFGDATGALAAYDLADTTLAAVNDGEFAPVRRSLAAEREALAAVEPASRANDLATLADLRARLPTLPLRNADDRPDTGDRTFWQRAGDALGSIVTVSHDDGTPLGLADDRIARELAALDVAHAEAAVLAYDDAGRKAALERVDRSIDARFDPSSPAVRDARARIAALLASKASAPKPSLGAALTELRNLRSVHALNDKAPASPAPASASVPAEAPAPAPASSTAQETTP